jgi:hypothetical protein
MRLRLAAGASAATQPDITLSHVYISKASWLGRCQDLRTATNDEGRRLDGGKNRTRRLTRSSPANRKREAHEVSAATRSRGCSRTLSCVPLSCETIPLRCHLPSGPTKLTSRVPLDGTVSPFLAWCGLQRSGIRSASLHQDVRDPEVRRE